MVNWQQDTGAKRTHDLPGEMKPVKPQLAPQKTHADSTGFTSQVAGLMTDNIMERAVKDRMQQAVDEEKAQYADGDDTEEVAANANGDEDEDRDGGATREEDDLEVLRARRREQMKKAHEKKQKYIQLGHGMYDEIEEEEFLKTVTASERCIVHFYHRNFERCKIMDMHLSKCAKQFFGTKFVKLVSGQTVEAHLPSLGNAIIEDDHAWQSLDLQFIDEEGCFLGVELHKLRTEELLGAFAEVHVHDLASLEIPVVEMHDATFRSCDGFQKLFFLDLVVHPMAELDILLLLPVRFLHLLPAAGTQHFEVVLLAHGTSVFVYVLFSIVVFRVWLLSVSRGRKVVRLPARLGQSLSS